jgi:hypothetical protein
MIRKIGLTLLCATSLLASNICFATEHMMSQAATYEFPLPANEPQVFTNTFFWTIESKCTIKSNQENNPFSFTVLLKSGTLNGMPLKKGDTVDLLVHPGDQLYISAESGGRIELTNHGLDLVTASCVSGR